MPRKRLEGPEALAMLLAVPLGERIVAVADDIRSKKDRFKRVDPFDLAAALGVPQPESPDGQWIFLRYAERLSLEERIRQGMDITHILDSLEGTVEAARLDLIEKAIRQVRAGDKKAITALRASERADLEDFFANDPWPRTG